MNQIMKFAWSGAAVALAAFVAMAMLVSTTSAAQPTVVNVIIDDVALTAAQDPTVGDDSILSPTTTTGAPTIPVYVDVDDGDAGVKAGLTDETLVTLTTSAGFFENGSNSIVIACAVDATTIVPVAADDSDVAGDDNDATVGVSEGTFNGAAETAGYPNDGEAAENTDTTADDEGCLGVGAFLTIPVGTAAGNVVITATTSNGATGADILSIVAATTATTATGVTVNVVDSAITPATSADPVADAEHHSIVTVQAVGSTGANATSTADVVLTTDRGTFNSAATCAAGTSLGTTTVVTLGTTDSEAGVPALTAGSARVRLCAGTTTTTGTATVTADPVPASLGANASDTVVVSGLPAAVTVTVPDVNLGDAPTGTVTVTATDSAGAIVAPEYQVQITAGPATVCANAEGAGTAEAVGADSVETDTIVAVGTVGNCVLAATALEPAASTGITAGTVHATGVAVENIQAGSTTPPPSGGSGEFSGTIAPSGVSLVVWGGGTLAELIAEAEAQGLLTMSVTVNGEFVTYVVGAPSFVNASFVALFPNGLEANTAVAVVTR